MKRIKLKSNNPNPLFEFWLEEWKNEAASRKSDLQQHFAKALVSLKRYPLPLKSGKDCIILQNFGTKLCSMLDKKFEQYNVQNKNSRMRNVFICTNCNIDDQNDVSLRKHNNLQTGMECIQQSTELTIFDGLNISSWNLENYAVLLSLYNKIQYSHYSGCIPEDDLLNEAKKLYCDTSKASISVLFDSGLISMTGSPIRYSLTAHGTVIAKKICEIADIDRLITSLDELNELQSRLHSIFEHCSALIDTSQSCKKNVNIQLPVSYKSIDTICMNVKNPLNIQEVQRSEFTVSHTHDQLSQNFYHCHTQKNATEGITSKTGEAKRIEKMGEIRSKESKRVQIKAANCKKNVTDNLQKDIILQATKFDVILLVDTQETCGGKTKPQHDATIVELTEFGVLFEVRHLKVGDFAWIARCKSTNNELTLPYIVERKRIDDLSASITDGRFHEQKFRLKQSGIKNLIYIVEEYDKSHRLAIPHSSLMQAAINTSIQDSFALKYTKNHKDSMFYLSSLTRILTRIYKSKNLIGCKKENLTSVDVLNNPIGLMEFEEFNKAASKQKAFKVSQMFISQLLQLKGMSVDKAIAITERYPTPRLLTDAINKSNCNRELLLADIQYSDKKRMIGPAISKTICQLYMRKSLSS